MSFQPRDNSGALFKNERKKQPNHPDYRGEVVVAGVAFYLSGWARKSKGGVAYLSLALSPKKPDREDAPSRPRSAYPVSGRPPARQPGEDDDTEVF